MNIIKNYLEENKLNRPYPNINIFQLHRSKIEAYKCNYLFNGISIKFLLNFPKEDFTDLNSKLLNINNSYHGGTIQNIIRWWLGTPSSDHFKVAFEIANTIKKLTHAERRASILTAALEAAEALGYIKITREDVAVRAGVSPGLVSYHFNHIKEMRDEVISEAIRVENLPVLAQAVGVFHDDAMEMEMALFDRVMEHIREVRG